jgi:hypothetical protein
VDPDACRVRDRRDAGRLRRRRRHPERRARRRRGRGRRDDADRVDRAAPKSIAETAASRPQFSSLVAAVQFASRVGDLVRLLSGAGTFTVFAPTNDAFDALARELTRNPAAIDPVLAGTATRRSPRPTCSRRTAWCT